jgi:hypothetical protein
MYLLTNDCNSQSALKISTDGGILPLPSLNHGASSDVSATETPMWFIPVGSVVAQGAAFYQEQAAGISSALLRSSR